MNMFIVEPDRQIPDTDVSAFSERDTEVLRLIGEENLIGFGFEGLRRKLGIHPETLSRSLKRLEEQHILEKTGDGYRVTHEGKEKVILKQLSNSEPRITLLKTLLPPVEVTRHVFMNLRGKWFGSLRWLGWSEDERGTTMKWVAEDGGVQIDAILSDGELIIEGQIRKGKDLTDAIRASHQLVGYFSRLYQTTSQHRAYNRLYDSFQLHN